MHQPPFRFLAVAAALASALLSVSAAEADAETRNGVTVEHTWARATPGGATVGAAFFEIKTDAKTADRLVAVATPVAGRAEVHTHIMDGDVMKMRRVDAVDIAAGGTRLLKPGGDHVMLLDLKQPLKVGDHIKMTLTFEKAGAFDVEATVVAAGAAGPHGMAPEPSQGDEKSGTAPADEHQHHH